MNTSRSIFTTSEIILQAMKNTVLFKTLFLGICFIFLANGCDVNDDKATSKDFFSNKENQLFINKSADFDWNNCKVEVSFEDDFEKFSNIEMVSKKGARLGHLLSENNLKQGITIKLKVIDNKSRSEEVAEIMIESFDLKKGKNHFTIGHTNNTPYIIY